MYKWAKADYKKIVLAKGRHTCFVKITKHLLPLLESFHMAAEKWMKLWKQMDF